MLTISLCITANNSKYLISVHHHKQVNGSHKINGDIINIKQFYLPQQRIIPSARIFQESLRATSHLTKPLIVIISLDIVQLQSMRVRHVWLMIIVCRFCAVNRVFHPRPNGQWPSTSKDFYTRSYPLHYFLIFILLKEAVFPFSMLSAKQGNYWYHLYNV